MNLGEIVKDICLRAGLPPEAIDVSELTDEVVGYQIPRQMPAKTALEPLMAAFNFDAAEVDWKLVFRKRGASSSRSLGPEDLRARRAEEPPPDLAVEVRTQDIEIPTQLTVAYESKARDYEIAVQRAVRTDKAPPVIRSAQLGVVMTDEHAKRQAEILLKRLWTERHRYRFSVSRKHIGIAPADVITVLGKQMRVIEIRDRLGVLEISCESEESGVYQSAAAADGLAFTPPDLAADLVVPEFLLLDLPPLDEDTGQAGLYVAIYSGAENFSGGIVERSVDGGQTYQAVAQSEARRAVVGTCSGTLGAGDVGILDQANTLTVDLSESRGTLSSASDAQLWNGANLAAVGSAAGGWEILQFQTAALVSGYTYTISGLLRGLYGTQSQVAAHGTQEKFVLLSGMSGISFAGAALEAIGAVHRYRGRSRSGRVGPPVLSATGDRAIRPYPVQGPFAAVDEDGDLHLFFRRGDRYEFAQPDFPDGGDVPLSELSETYEVDVVHPTSGAVLRTIRTDSPHVEYTAAQRSADGYPAGQTVFDIYQISRVVGRGVVRRATVP